jgi:hypothetical protein
MDRKPDWMARLQSAVETAKVLPFSYGLHDCCTFAAYCVDAMTGSELVNRMQREHPYNSEETAYDVIHNVGGLVPLLDLYLPVRRDNALFAAPGDVVIVEDNGRQLVGVLIGHGVAAPGATGLMNLPTSSIQAAWEV